MAAFDTIDTAIDITTDSDDDTDMSKPPMSDPTGTPVINLPGFSRLSQELRDAIWDEVLNNTQQRLLKERRAHFFQLEYAGGQSEPETYSLSLPIYPWQRKTMVHMAELEWMATQDSRDWADKHVKDLLWEFPEADDADGNYGTDHALGSSMRLLEKLRPNSTKRQTVVRFPAISPCSGLGKPEPLSNSGKSLLLPVGAVNDLLVIQVSHEHWQKIHLRRAYGPTISQFQSRHIGLEFDPAWGYPEGANASNIDCVIHPAAASGGAVEDSHWALGRWQFVKDLARMAGEPCGEPMQKLWFIDYRLGIRDDAVVHVEAGCDDPRFVFKDAMWAYVEVQECDSFYWMEGDGIDIFRFVTLLQEATARRTSTKDSKLGVLARVPLPEWEQRKYSEDTTWGQGKWMLVKYLPRRWRKLSIH